MKMSNVLLAETVRNPLVKELFSQYNVTKEEAVSIITGMHKKDIDKLIAQGIHTHKISIPKRPGGIWSTYVYDETRPNNRKQIQGRSEEAFYQSLYEWYNANEKSIMSVSMEEILEEVLAYKKDVMLNDSYTIYRLRHDFDTFYKGQKISSIPISHITSNDCEDFFNGIIANGIKVQCFNNVIGVSNAIFDYAVKRLGIIEKSPLKNAHLNRKLLIKGLNEEDESRVYFHDERDKLFAVIQKHLGEDDYQRKVDLYIILLAFKLALRIGEFAALKSVDISRRFDEVTIRRMEKSRNVTVVEHTKSYEVRRLPLSDYEYKILAEVEKLTSNCLKDKEYIFRDAEGRRTVSGIDKTLRKICDEAGIPRKSYHDIRRTVASEMHMNGCTLEEIRKFMGHRDIKTTQGYIYNLKRQSAYHKLIHDSLKGNELKL